MASESMSNLDIIIFNRVIEQLEASYSISDIHSLIKF